MSIDSRADHDGQAPAAPLTFSGDRVPLLPIGAFVGFVAITVLFARVSSGLADIAGLILFAAALAWLLSPLHQRLGNRIGTGASISVIILGSLIGGLVVGGLLLADLDSGALSLADSINAAIASDGGTSLMERLQRSLQLGDGLENWLSSLPDNLLFGEVGTTAVGERVLNLIIVLVLAAFFLASGKQMVAGIVAWWPREEREQVWQLVGDIDTRAGGYLRRIVVVGFLSGLVVAITAAAVGASFPVALGMWAGFWLVVPVVGWFVALVPVVFTALYLDLPAGIVLLAVGVGTAVSVALLRRRAATSPRLRPGVGVVVPCLAVGVAIGGSAAAILTLIVGLVVLAIATSTITGVRLPTQQVDGAHVYRAGPITIPHGVRGMLLCLAIVVVSVIAWTIAARAAAAIVWIIVAGLLAIALDRPIAYLSRRLHLPRTASVALTFLLVGGAVTALVLTAVSEGPTSAARALQRMPEVLGDLESAPLIGDLLADNNVATTVTAELEQLPTRVSESRGALAWFPSLGSQLVALLWILLLTLAFSLDGGRVINGATKRVPARYRRQVARFTDVSHSALAGYAAGAVLVSAMNGTVVLILALVLQLGLAPLLAVWAFAWDFIPQVGGVIGGIPLILLSLVAGPAPFIIATVVYTVWQIIESNVIFPAIIGDSVDIPAWAAMVAALVGAAAGGVVGAIVLAPLVGVVRLAVMEYRREDFPGRTAAASAAHGADG